MGSSFPRQVRRSDPPLRVPALVPSVMDYTWKYKLKQTPSTSRLLLGVVLNTEHSSLGSPCPTLNHTPTRTTARTRTDQAPTTTGMQQSTLVKQGAPELHPKAATARSLRKARFKRRIHQKRTVSCT